MHWPPLCCQKTPMALKKKSDWPTVNVRPKLQRCKTCLSLSWNQAMCNLPGSEVDRDRLPRRHAGVQRERNRGKASRREPSVPIFVFPQKRKRSTCLLLRLTMGISSPAKLAREVKCVHTLSRAGPDKVKPMLGGGMTPLLELFSQSRRRFFFPPLSSLMSPLRTRLRSLESIYYPLSIR